MDVGIPNIVIDDHVIQRGATIPPPIVDTYYVLLENSNKILLENGAGILLEK